MHVADPANCQESRLIRKPRGEYDETRVFPQPLNAFEVNSYFRLLISDLRESYSNSIHPQ